MTANILASATLAAAVCLLVVGHARAEAAPPTIEQAIAEADARIAQAKGFACDLQDKACLSRELVQRGENDQWIRGLLGPLCGYRSECRLYSVVAAIDAPNARRADQVLRVHGWPAGPGWAPEVEDAIFHIVNHMPHDNPQITNWRPLVLPDVRRSAEAGRLPGALYAKMYDRLETQAGRPQRYGTQSYCALTEGEPNCRLLQLEQPAQVNALRAELGMEPLSAEEIASAQ